MGDEMTNSGSSFVTLRVLPASAGGVFAAFENPERLARWWGPNGFTNTFERFAFEPGGDWIFVMHGPNGIDYPNASRFVEIEPDARVVVEHVSAPRFTLTVALESLGDATRLTWTQTFEDAEIAAKVRAIVEPANEQNLDRLEAELAAGTD